MRSCTVSMLMHCPLRSQHTGYFIMYYLYIIQFKLIVLIIPYRYGHYIVMQIIKH